MTTLHFFYKILRHLNNLYQCATVLLKILLLPVYGHLLVNFLCEWLAVELSIDGADVNAND